MIDFEGQLSKADLNEQSRSFVTKTTSRLISKYQRDWMIADNSIRIISSRDTTVLPNHEELQARVEKNKQLKPKLEEQASIMQLFPAEVAKMSITGEEMPLPEFLGMELAHLEDTDGLLMTIDYTKKFEENHKTGFNAMVFAGMELALKLNFGDKDGNPTNIVTSFSLCLMNKIQGI
ncbi:MAG TPA: hypothetical protein VG895_01300 [Patescibacteria group bacterium]|nr:hypothetical protein [Patescibacteria group bacterium]